MNHSKSAMFATIAENLLKQAAEMQTRGMPTEEHERTAYIGMSNAYVNLASFHQQQEHLKEKQIDKYDE